MDEIKVIPPVGTVYAIGNFDGVHLGHRRLFNICRDIASKNGCGVCALTFDGLWKDGGRLISSADRELYLKKSGADHVLTVNFDEIRDMSAEDFIEEYLVKTLSPSAVVCGEDFRFGRGALGDVALLRERLNAHRIPLHIAQTAKVGGRVVSTSRIKSALSQGDAPYATALLARRYSFEYPVEEGKHLGRTIGAPTINQKFPGGMFIPKFGVYAGDVDIDGVVYPCVTNIGTRPTVDDGDSVTAESYIVGYEGNLYGRSIRVNLTEYLRGEMRFDSVDALGEQITKDAETAKRIFERLEK